MPSPTHCSARAPWVTSVTISRNPLRTWRGSQVSICSRERVAIVVAAGFAPSSCDLTIICLEPAIAPRRDEIRGVLATAMGLDVAAVSVKATRPEGLGLNGDGIGCMAVAVVRPVTDGRTSTA